MVFRDVHMSQRAFNVTAIWDEEEQIWYSDSDLVGLHIEAESFPEFQTLVSEYAAELIVANHYSEGDLDGASLKDLIPAIVISQQGHPAH